MSVYLPQMNMKAIRQTCELYNSTVIASIGRTNPNEYAESWLNKAVYHPRIKDILWLYYENADLLADDNSIVCLDSLLRMPLERIRLVSCGTYYSHCICINITCGKNAAVKISAYIYDGDDTKIKELKNRFNLAPINEQIKMLFDNFENVYIRIPIINDRKEIEEAIAKKRLIEGKK